MPVSLTLSPIKDAGGMIDLRHRARHHRAPAPEQLRLLARAVESTNEMVSVTDTDDRITFVNAAFCAPMAIPPEVIGQTPALMQSAQTSRRFRKFRANRGATGGPASC